MKKKDPSKINIKLIEKELKSYHYKTNLLFVAAVLTLFALVIKIYNGENYLTGAVIGVSVNTALNFFLPALALFFFLMAYQRQNQTLEDKISKQVTGLSYRNPKMADRIIEDKKIVRAKYGLPPAKLLSEDPSEYIRRMEDLIKRRRIRIEELRNWGGAMANEDTIRINPRHKPNYNDKNSLIKYGAHLTHEYVHHLQGERMPIEQAEYEAYLVSGTDDPARLKKERTRKGLFGAINWSSNFWYKEHNKTG